MSSDEEQLARAIIRRALSDAGVGAEDGERLTVHQMDRDEARSFLLAVTGGWKESRIFWCDIAALDPEQLRRGTMQALGLRSAPDTKPPEPPQSRPRMARNSRPRLGSKLGLLVELLETDAGISMAEIMATFGWSRVTCSTALGSDLPARYGLRATRGPDGRYRLTHVT